MKIKILYGEDENKLEHQMNEFLEEVIEKNFMIIDYGVEGRDKGGVYGYIKYCTKQFLRDYKIDSIMKEREL